MNNSISSILIILVCHVSDVLDVIITPVITLYFVSFQMQLVLEIFKIRTK